jgi:hypothetical protein
MGSTLPLAIRESLSLGLLFKSFTFNPFFNATKLSHAQIIAGVKNVTIGITGLQGGKKFKSCLNMGYYREFLFCNIFQFQ